MLARPLPVPLDSVLAFVADGARHGADGFRKLLRLLSTHTGIPVLLLAAVLLVVSYRAFKRSVRLLVEVAIALALLLVATHLGWIRW
jgi:hypothetical protein